MKTEVNDYSPAKLAENHTAYLSRYGREDSADTLALRNRLCPVLPAPEPNTPDHQAIAADADGRKTLIEGEWSVEYGGLFGPVIRVFPSRERAIQWARQVGKYNDTETRLQPVREQ